MPDEPSGPSAAAPKNDSKPFTPVTWVICWIFLAAAYALTGLLCVNISAQVANVSWLFYIPAGISLSAALLWGRGVWPGIFVGEFAMALLTHQSLSSSLIMSSGNGLDAALAGWWFHDRLGRRIEFDRLRDVIGLLAVELLVLQPMGALFGMAAISMSQPIPRGMYAQAFGAWYSANIFAQFVMAPACLVWTQRNRVKRPVRYLELAAAIIVTLIVGAFGPGRWASDLLPLPMTFILIFPLLVWCAVRFPPSIAITAGTVLGFFAFDAALVEAGPFAAIPANERLLYLNGFMAITIGTSLFLAAAMGDSVRFESEQDRLIGDLTKALSHVERLKELVTFCAWTGRVRWNNQWVSVEQFLRDRYQVHITHGISEDAMEAVLIEAEKLRKESEKHGGPPPGDSLNPFPTPPAS